MDLQKLCKEVCELAITTGNYIKSEREKPNELDVEVKSRNSLVTHVDKTAEKRIIDKLAALLPDSGFIAEEGTNSKKGEIYNWVIDPLDGTTNFIHSIPCYAVSIALLKNEEIILGVVYEINLKECFYAWEGSKAFLNDKEISVTKTTKLENSLIATGFPYYDYGKLKEYLDLLGFFAQNTRGIRRLGSAATDLAYVACGRFDAYYEYGLSPWDVAAGAFIVKQAGGNVSSFSNTNNFMFGKEIVASNSILHQPVIDAIHDYFGTLDKKIHLE